ncbi:MAG TPA: hypothetical protein VN883_04535 [Myxococcales bacterium]|nr:hypothetical protein [Myxococcales bacterium]
MRTIEQVRSPRSAFRCAALCACLALAAAFRAGAVELRYPPGDLHGFPSMQDESGALIADGELTQRKHGSRLVVHATWRFRDGRVVVEDAVFALRPQLAQQSFRFVESRGKTELRRFEVDFRSRKAYAQKLEGTEHKRWDDTLDLEPGKAFTGFGTALAVSQLRDSLAKKDAVAELTFVAFTPGPRTVTLEVSRRQGERVRAAGRELRADLYTLHPKIPFPISIFVHPKDARLWFSHGAPPALLRAEQNLIEKDDPRIRIDVIPAGSALPSPAARRGPRPHR